MLLVYWPTNGGSIILTPDNVTTGIKATVVLHNILTLPMIQSILMLWITGMKYMMMPFKINLQTAASDVRNYFSDYFNSDHGSVEWQNNYA